MSGLPWVCTRESVASDIQEFCPRYAGTSQVPGALECTSCRQSGVDEVQSVCGVRPQEPHAAIRRSVPSARWHWNARVAVSQVSLWRQTRHQELRRDTQERPKCPVHWNLCTSCCPSGPSIRAHIGRLGAPQAVGLEAPSRVVIGGVNVLESMRDGGESRTLSRRSDPQPPYLRSGWCALLSSRVGLMKCQMG